VNPLSSERKTDVLTEEGTVEKGKQEKSHLQVLQAIPTGVFEVEPHNDQTGTL